MSVPRSCAAISRSITRSARKTNPRVRSLPTPRCLHGASKIASQAAAHQRIAEVDTVIPAIENTPLSFPCLDKVEAKTEKLHSKRFLEGPEPSYTAGEHETFHSNEPILLDWGGVLPSFDIAYETWGTLNEDKSNAILLHTGLSASSHAHSTPSNPKPGWWERFIGPGAPIDTDRYFVICTNVLGGCYGSTGPSSISPLTGKHYGTSFPILTMADMVRAQYSLLDNLGIDKLYASVGSSMGGMQSLAISLMAPERVGRIVSISGCARSHPYSIAMRHTQRQVLIHDPAWSSTRGNYYTSLPPHTGMKLAREIATITYRSGPEWEARFGRRRVDDSKPPALCPDFLIETYLDHAGEKWCLEFDANSLLYVSKAMDLFDLGAEMQSATRERREGNAWKLRSADKATTTSAADACTLDLPDKPYEETSPDVASSEALPATPTSESSVPADLIAGLAPLKNHPILVLGVSTDLLFPAFQQREIANALKEGGNRDVTHVELGEERSLFGHDTFLLDLEGVGGAVRGFLG
nr:Serine O-acetyltransferase [Rachicladosporium sp. CCFEE 5018]